nr:carbohydrate ABC transporter permease [uncultured Acetatifactor sp.]
MKIKSSPARKAFVVINYVILTLIMFISLFPLIHIFALSLSSNSAAQAGWVTVLPVNFTLDSYEYILQKPEFFKSFGVSVLRVVLGTVISVALTIISAYAMSQPDERFHARKYYVWVFLVTMVFSGGLIPLFIVVKSVGIYNSIWALVLPSAVQTFNVILMLNFFRGLPYALTESALIDGANHFQIMAKIVVPISKPSLATVGLFTMVNHWNSWFDGMIYLSDTAKYPMQTYLRNVINSVDAASLDLNSVGAMTNVSQKTVTAAQIFVAIIPILLVYPFLQKYFISGMTLGSVKE